MKNRVLAGSALLITAFQLLIIGADNEKNNATNTAAAVAGRLAGARSGGCAANLPDGSVLITGGHGLGGLLGSAEIFSAKGGAKDVASMLHPRENHACATLPNGSVLVAGGSANGGGATNSAEIYNPKTGAWTLADSMSTARSGVAAVAITGGKVLIAGGESNGIASATVDIYDPATGHFTAVPGALTSPRMRHAAVALNSGQVLIAGGSDGNNSLDSIDIYNPATGAISRLNAKLSTPRDGLTATVLLDGRVFFTGGSNGKEELATTEIYNPTTGAITAGAPMSAARKGHIAVRVPNNNSVYITGGNTHGGILLLTEVYIPWWNSFKSIGQAGGQAKKGTASFAVAAVGDAVDTPVLPTLFTDKGDYYPGEIAQISGSGWTPSTDVQFVIAREPDPTGLNSDDSISRWTATTDADGNLSSTYLVRDGDLNTTLTLTASSGAGDTAQIQTIIFTDADTKILTFLTGPFSVSVNACAGPMQVRRMKNGGPDPSNSTSTHSLTTNGTGAFYSDNTCTTAITSVTIAANASDSPTFYYKPTAAGTGTHAITVGTAGGYDAVSQNVTVSGGAQNQTITFGALANRTFGDADFNVSATASSGLTVTFTASGSCSVTGTLVHITGAGSCTITAHQAGNVSFNAAPDVPQSFTIAKANQAALTLITTSPLTYLQSEALSTTGGTTGGTVTYNLVSGSCGITTNQLTANSGTGSCTLTATMSGDTNYNDVTSTPANTVTLQKANQAALTLITSSPLTYLQSETLSATGGTTAGTVTYNLVTGSCGITTNQLTANSGTGSCTLTATMSGDANYNDVTSTPANTVTLQKANQAALTLITTSPLTYLQSETLSATGGTTAGAVTYNLLSGSCSIVTNQLTANSGTGDCTLTATMAGNGNYNDVTSTPANTVSLQKANQAALTLSTSSPLTYLQSETLSATGGTTAGVVTYNLVSGSCSIVTNQLTANSGTGDCTLTATMAGNGNYNDVTSTPANTVTLQKANQAALTLITSSPLTYLQSETLSTSGGSTAGTVTYNLLTGSCSIATNQLTANSGTGDCALTATMAGNANYNDVTSTPANTVSLQKANQTALTLITTSPLTYLQSENLSTSGGSTAGAVTYNLLTGSCLLVTNQLTANSGTGSCTLTATMAGNANYNDVTSTPANTVTLQKANQAALTLVTTSPLTYLQSENLSTSGGSTAGAVTYNLLTGSCLLVTNQLTANSGTGSCTLTATMAGNTNYNDVTSTPANTVTLQKANQAALTLNSTSPLIYLQSETLSATGGTTGGGVTYNLLAGPCGISTNQLTANSGAGSCSLTATMAGDANYNDVTSAPANTVTLQKANQTTAVVVTAPTSVTYGSTGTAAATGGNGTGGYSFSAGASTGCAVVATTVSVSNASLTCALTAIRAGDNNYYASAPSAAFPVTLVKVTLTVNPDNKSRPYNTANPPLTYTLSGFVNGENAITAAVTGSPALSTTAALLSPVSPPTYPIACSSTNTLGANNYNFVCGSAGALTVTLRPTAISLTGATSVNYGNCGTYNYAARLVDITGGLPGTPLSGQTVTIAIGTQIVTGTTDATGTLNALITINQLPGSILGSATFAGTSTLAASSSGALPITIVASPYVGAVPGSTIYTGPSLYWTANSTSSTATVTLSATIKDLMGCSGDIRTAKVTFATRNGDGSFSPIPSAQNLPVGLVSPTDPTVGSASAIVQFNIGNQQVEQLTIAVILGGNYTHNVPADDTLITIAQPGQANSMVGNGTVSLMAAPLSSGFLGQQAGIPNGIPGYLQVAADVAYSLKGNNPQNPHGSITLLFRSYNKPDGTVDTALHTYFVKSTAIASLTKPTPGTLSFTAKGNLQDVTNPASTISLDGGATFQVTTENATATYPNGRISVALQPKSGGIWIVSGWSGTAPVLKQLLSGGIIGQ